MCNFKEQNNNHSVCFLEQVDRQVIGYLSYLIITAK